MNLLKSLSMISGMTLVSRILGFFRDVIIARVFGAGFAVDAFVVAFKLPNLLRRIFAEGAFSQSFVPVLIEHKERQTEKETRVFLAQITGLLSLSLFIITAVGVIGAPWIMWVSAPGFHQDPAKFDLAVTLLRINFPYILFISLASLASSVLNAWHQFSIPAFAPALLNLSSIVCALFLAPYCDPPVLALSIAVFIGGVAQLAFQLPHLKRINMLPMPLFIFKNSAVWKVVKQMGPAVFGVSIAQISLVINTIFASFLVSGSISWMYYADRLMEFPVGLLGAALGVVLLPLLSKHAVDGHDERFSQLLDWAIRLSLILAVPASVGLAVLSMPLIKALFMHGKFTLHDAQMTQQALMAYSVGLVGLILVKVLAPSFYARKDIKTPVKIAVFTLVMTQVMNAIFVWRLHHAGLSLSIALGACLNAGLLLFLLLKYNLYKPQAGWRLFLLQLFSAMVAMVIVLEGLQYILPCDWEGPFLGRILWLALLIVAGAGAYFMTLFAAGLRLSQWVHQE